MKTRAEFRLMLAFVIAGSFILRFLYAGSFELLQEEAYYWNYAQHLDIGYLDHPPMVAVLISIATAVFGNSEFAVRIAALFCWCIAALFVYLYTREIYCRDTALQSAAIMSIVPAFFIFGLLMTPDAPLIACWAGTLYFSRRALVAQDGNCWIGVGIFLGLGLFSKYTMALVGLALFVFLIVDKPSRRWLLKPHPYVAAVIALIIFSPVIYWNSQHDWASFLFQTQDRLTSSSEFSTHELLASIIILLSPVGFIAALFFLCRRKYFVGSEENRKRNYSFAVTTIVVPLAIFFIFSLSKEIKFNWTSPIWLAGLPFMARTLSPLATGLNTVTQKRFVRSWKITMVSLLIAYGWILVYYSIGIPGVPYAGEGPLTGWNVFANQVENIVESIEQQTGKRPYVIGMDLYKSASGLAFYRTMQLEKESNNTAERPIRETAGRSLFGKDAVMYDYWFTSAEMKGKPLLVISPDQEELKDWRLFGPSDAVGELATLQGKKNGHKLPPLYYRLVNIDTFNHEKAFSLN